MNRIIRMVTFITCTFLCACDSMFEETGCVYSGYLQAHNEFSLKDVMDLPTSTDMNLLVFPLEGEGITEYNNMIIPFNEMNIAEDNLLVGRYDFLSYNKGDNNIRIGDNIRDTEIYVNIKDGKIITEPQYIFSGSRLNEKITADDTLNINITNEILVQRIIFNIQIIDVPESIQFNLIEAELDGVTTSRNLYSRKKGSSFATLPFSITSNNPNKFSKEIIVFGINDGIQNTLHLNVVSNNDIMNTEVDLSSILKNFEAAGIEINLTLNYDALLKKLIINISDWQDINWGDINLTD